MHCQCVCACDVQSLLLLPVSVSEIRGTQWTQRQGNENVMKHMQYLVQRLLPSVSPFLANGFRVTTGE